MNGPAECPDENIDEPIEAAQAEAAENAADAADAAASDEQTEEGSELEALQAKVDEHYDNYLRAAAELDNVRKRAARDIESARRYALERFGKELLAVRDSLEMGIASAENATVESLLQGSEATLKVLGSTMEQFGIEDIDPAGEPFDPELHEAISMQPSENTEPGSVVTVVQKGYKLNGRLLRPAMVIVAAES